MFMEDSLPEISKANMGKNTQKRSEGIQPGEGFQGPSTIGQEEDFKTDYLTHFPASNSQFCSKFNSYMIQESSLKKEELEIETILVSKPERKIKIDFGEDFYFI